MRGKRNSGFDARCGDVAGCKKVVYRYTRAIEIAAGQNDRAYTMLHARASGFN